MYSFLEPYYKAIKQPSAIASDALEGTGNFDALFDIVVRYNDHSPQSPFCKRVERQGLPGINQEMLAFTYPYPAFE